MFRVVVSENSKKNKSISQLPSCSRLQSVAWDSKAWKQKTYLWWQLMLQSPASNLTFTRLVGSFERGKRVSVSDWKSLCSMSDLTCSKFTGNTTAHDDIHSPTANIQSETSLYKSDTTTVSIKTSPSFILPKIDNTKPFNSIAIQHSDAQCIRFFDTLWPFYRLFWFATRIHRIL